MRDGLIFSMILLSKEILKIFLSSVFFLIGVAGLSVLELIVSNDVKSH